RVLGAPGIPAGYPIRTDDTLWVGHDEVVEVSQGREVRTRLLAGGTTAVPVEAQHQRSRNGRTIAGWKMEPVYASERSNPQHIIARRSRRARRRFAAAGRAAGWRTGVSRYRTHASTRGTWMRGSGDQGESARSTTQCVENSGGRHQEQSKEQTDA